MIEERPCFEGEGYSKIPHALREELWRIFQNNISVQKHLFKLKCKGGVTEIYHCGSDGSLSDFYVWENSCGLPIPSEVWILQEANQIRLVVPEDMPKFSESMD